MEAHKEPTTPAPCLWPSALSCTGCSEASGATSVEVIPAGIQSHGLCRHCGRIGDHSTTCPEVE